MPSPACLLGRRLFCRQSTQHAPNSFVWPVSPPISDLTLKVKLLRFRNTALTQAVTQAETDLASIEQGNLSITISCSRTISPIYKAQTDALSTSSTHVSLPITFCFLNKASVEDNADEIMLPVSPSSLVFPLQCLSLVRQQNVSFQRPYLCQISARGFRAIGKPLASIDLQHQ